MSNKKYFDMKPKKYSMGVKFEGIDTGVGLANMLQSIYNKMYINQITNMQSHIFNSFYGDRILWKSPRFVVSFTGESVKIFDKKVNRPFNIEHIKKEPKKFTPALVKRLSFFEMYEKTQ